MVTPQWGTRAWQACPLPFLIPVSLLIANWGLLRKKRPAGPPPCRWCLVAPTRGGAFALCLLAPTVSGQKLWSPCTFFSGLGYLGFPEFQSLSFHRFKIGVKEKGI